jgi:hypothetical protein
MWGIREICIFIQYYNENNMTTITEIQHQKKDITPIVCLLGIAYMGLAGFLLPYVYARFFISAGWFALGFMCIWNFKSCGRYHCMITGPGFLVIGILSLSEALNIINLEEWVQWCICLAVLAFGFGLEYYYKLRSGTRYTNDICKTRNV